MRFYIVVENCCLSIFLLMYKKINGWVGLLEKYDFKLTLKKDASYSDGNMDGFL